MTLDNVSSLVVRLIIDIAYGRDRLFIRTVDFTYSCFHRQFEESFSVLKEFFDSTVSLGLHGIILELFPKNSVFFVDFQALHTCASSIQMIGFLPGVDRRQERSTLRTWDFTSCSSKLDKTEVS